MRRGEEIGSKLQLSLRDRRKTAAVERARTVFAQRLQMLGDIGLWQVEQVDQHPRGVLALATQLNHANVGPVNPALHAILGPAGARAGIADVVKGNDSAPKVTGFTAARGFDVASGWGTINASRFVPSLVAATRAENQEASARHQAAAQLSSIEHSIQLSPGVIPAGHEAYLLDQGFLPGHPVGLYIDNVLIRTLTASTSGYVTDTISPSRLGLFAGKHVLQLRSMLFTATRTFTSG